MKICILFGLLAAVLGQDDDVVLKDFHAIDVDGDGVIRLKDVFEHFNQQDTDDDGALTFSEYFTSRGHTSPLITVRAAFVVFDKMDGMVDNLIHKSIVCPYFKILDPNNDRGVSLADYRQNTKPIWNSMAEEVRALNGTRD